MRARIELPGGPYSAPLAVSAGPHGVLLANSYDGSLLSVVGGVPRTIATLPAEHGRPFRVVQLTDAAWVAAGSTLTPVLADGSMGSPPLDVGAQITAVAGTGHTLWVATQAGLVRVDTQNDQIEQVMLPAGVHRADDVTVDAAANDVWVVVDNPTRLLRFDADAPFSGGAIVAEPRQQPDLALPVPDACPPEPLVAPPADEDTRAAVTAAANDYVRRDRFWARVTVARAVPGRPARGSARRAVRCQRAALWPRHRRAELRGRDAEPADHAVERAHRPSGRLPLRRRLARVGLLPLMPEADALTACAARGASLWSTRGVKPSATARCHTWNGAWPPSAGSSNTSWIASTPPGATCGVQSVVVGHRDVLGVPAVDEQEAERRPPRARDRDRVADDRDHDVLEAGRVDRAPEERQRVHAPGLGIDDLGIVMVPTRLVLLRAAVVVDGEAHRLRLAGRRAEVHRRLPAVRADFEQRTDRAARDAGVVQREPFVVGHEALGRARDVEQVLVHRHRGAG